MKIDYKSKIKDHTDALEKIYKQRRIWLFSSSIVYTAIIFVIFSWNYLVEYAPDKVWWAMISVGLILSINWWYWTMRSLTTLVRSIYYEYEMLSEITEDIDHVKIILQCKSSNRTKCNLCPVNGGCPNKK